MAIRKYSPTTMERKLATDIKVDNEEYANIKLASDINLATEIGVPTQIDIFEIRNRR